MCMIHNIYQYGIFSIATEWLIAVVPSNSNIRTSSWLQQNSAYPNILIIVLLHLVDWQNILWQQSFMNSLTVVNKFTDYILIWTKYLKNSSKFTRRSTGCLCADPLGYVPSILRVSTVHSFGVTGLPANCLRVKLLPVFNELRPAVSDGPTYIGVFVYDDWNVFSIRSVMFGRETRGKETNCKT